MEKELRSNECEVNGKMYMVNRGAEALTRTLAPGERPDEVQVRTPHPDKDLRAQGFSLGWIFLMLPFACVIAAAVAAIAERC